MCCVKNQVRQCAYHHERCCKHHCHDCYKQWQAHHGCACVCALRQNKMQRRWLCYHATTMLTHAPVRSSESTGWEFWRVLDWLCVAECVSCINLIQRMSMWCV